MTRRSRRVLCGVFLRLLLIQGSWNYRTLIGSGFGFALLPVLRMIYGNDREGLNAAVQRHMALFNSHPYLATIALGVVAALEAQGVDATIVQRYKDALRGSLGTLGDRLVWTGWRPVCLLGALTLYLGGAPWWAGVIVFLLVYNVGHLAMRLWGLKIGWESPRQIGERLRHPALDRIRLGLDLAGPFLIGLTLVLLLAGSPPGGIFEAPAGVPVPIWWLVGGVAVAVGIWLGERSRKSVVLAISGFTILGLILGSIK